jgi:Holliday junction resolvase RusA-like endonuclease
MSESRKPTQAVVIELPPPISVNALYRAIVRSGSKHAINIKSEKYRDWIIGAGKILEEQNPGFVAGHYGLRISLPVNCRMDLDNSVKCVSDLLQSHNVIENDRLMQRLEVWRGAGETMQVWVISTREVK